jgi:ketosteroid isomerase-like protein
MPREDVEVVRQPVALASGSRRRLEERFALRSLRARAVLAGAMWRLYLLLPPRSRLRQAIVRHYMRLGVEALNRRDLEAAFMLYHPDAESIFDERLVALGFEPVYRGREARIEGQKRWIAEWGDERTEIEELIDLGHGRLLLLARNKGSGPSSGAAVDMKTAFLFTLAAGQVIREQLFLDRNAAFEAAGLQEQDAHSGRREGPRVSNPG